MAIALIVERFALRVVIVGRGIVGFIYGDRLKANCFVGRVGCTFAKPLAQLAAIALACAANERKHQEE